MAVLTPLIVPLYRDRGDAGRQLGARLGSLADERPIVVALPRGGVPVGFEVAAALAAPLDVLVVRKLGAPLQPELGVGAIAEEDVTVVNPELVDALGIETEELLARVEAERAELERRVRLYRGEREPVPLADRTVILVDDGIATGGTAIAAARALRRRGAARIVLVVPVGPPGLEARVGSEVDEVICLESPEDFFAVGPYYEHFAQTSDEEVVELLARASEGAPERDRAGADPARKAGGIDGHGIRRRAVDIAAGEALLPGDVRVPPAATGLVVFAHGSGSSRLSPRNVQVAGALGAAGLATLLFDLLSEREAAERAKVFDIALLVERLVAAVRWAQADAELAALPIGLFGASTGAAAALWAAAELGGEIRAVVSRGGRPDLAEPRLAEVVAPTLLIVGGADDGVIELNQRALAELRCEAELVLVPGATHLFEEPGALEQVAANTARWFADHLATKRA